MEIGREEMYIARGHPRMGACTLSRSLSLSKGRRRVAETRALRQAQRPRFGRRFSTELRMTGRPIIMPVRFLQRSPARPAWPADRQAGRKRCAIPFIINTNP